jgi:hypothetical protein
MINLRDSMSQMAQVIATAAEHNLDAWRVFDRILDAHAGERQMPLFKLCAEFAEDLQHSRTTLIAPAESLEILRPVFPFDLVSQVSSVIADYFLDTVLNFSIPIQPASLNNDAN